MLGDIEILHRPFYRVYRTSMKNEANVRIVFCVCPSAIAMGYVRPSPLTRCKLTLKYSLILVNLRFVWMFPIPGR